MPHEVSVTMYPLLFGTLPGSATFLAVAVLVGVGVAIFNAPAAGIPRRRLALALPVFIVAGMTGAKLHSLIERSGNVYSLAWEARNGYRYAGAIVGIALGTLVARGLLFRRVPWGRLADCLAPAIALAMAAYRLGCFCEGCCFGVVSTLPWAVRFPAGSPAWRQQVTDGLLAEDSLASLPVHPLQIYFLVLALLIGLSLLRVQHRKAYDGQVILLFLALHDAGKFLLEFLRSSTTQNIQICSAIVALVATGLLAGFGGRAPVPEFTRRPINWTPRSSRPASPPSAPASSRGVRQSDSAGPA